MSKKKITSLLLSACMILSPILSPITVRAEGEGPGGVETVSGGDLENVYIDEDFEGEVDTSWGMTGDLAEYFSVKTDSTTGNNYLNLTTVENNKAYGKSAVKNFGELPKMSKARISFTWNLAGITSTDYVAHPAIRLQNGETEVVALYASDLRDPKKLTNTLYYSTEGYAKKKAVDGFTIAYGGTYNVVMDIDFNEHIVKVSFNGTEIISESISEVLNKVDQLAIVCEADSSPKTYATDINIDNFVFEYQVNETEDETAYIYSLSELDVAAITKEQYEAGYQHPTKVKGLLSNGDPYEFDIDETSWSSVPEFDKDVTNFYTWSADIFAPSEYENKKSLKASYGMEYDSLSISNHDYENNFLISSDYAAFEKWGKSMDSSSGDGDFSLTIESDANGVRYLDATVTGNGDRGSKVKISDEIVKGAEISFDWMPIATNGKGIPQIMFVSPGKNHPYFILRSDLNFNISYYTVSPLSMSSTTQAVFDGSISKADAVVTHTNAQNKWYTINVKFDYLAHTADLIITEKGTENTVTKTGIPIETEANGLQYFLIHMEKLNSGASVTQGVNNLKVDYVKFDENDVVAVTNPSNVNVAESNFDNFVFPTSVTVTVGGGEKTEIGVGDWAAEPTFVRGTSGIYQWSAPLVTGNRTNPFGLVATFSMKYTDLPFPTYVWSPKTLELPFGGSFTTDMLPTTARALLSNGEYQEVALGEWVALREFDAANEGIYIYGAKVVDVDGVYQVEQDQITPNENPDDPAEFKKAIENYKDYNVYYRISYYKNESNNKNGYTRSVEYLNRGVYAITSDKGIFVSWRLLVDEYGEDISFNVFRNNEKIASGIDNVTYYIDANGKAGDIYYVEKVQDGYKYKSDEVTALGSNYLSIAMQKPDPQPNKNGVLSEYTLNDAGVADVDGDGVYEFIVKWYPGNAFDSGVPNGPS